MEGITVLTEASPMSAVLTTLILLFIFITVAGMGVFLAIYLAGTIWDKVKGGFGAVFMIFVFISLIVAHIALTISITGLVSNKINERDRSYKITIDDSVSFNEFNAKYKVLKQDGRIFTVVEREVESSEKSKGDTTESQTNISE